MPSFRNATVADATIGPSYSCPLQIQTPSPSVTAMVPIKVATWGTAHGGGLNTPLDTMALALHAGNHLLPDASPAE